MPDFEYRGHSPGLYPMLRDARGALAGTVGPGDVLEFDAAPDGDWRPCEAGGDERGGIESEADPADVPAAPPPWNLTPRGEAGSSPDPGSEQDDDTAGNTAGEES